MTSYEMLERAYRLIEDPARWGQGSYYKNGRYCAVGALNVAASGLASMGPTQEEAEAWDSAFHALYRTACPDGDVSLTEFNDYATHEAIMTVFREALYQLGPAAAHPEPGRRIIVEPIEVPAPREVPQEEPEPVTVPDRERDPEPVPA